MGFTRRNRSRRKYKRGQKTKTGQRTNSDQKTTRGQRTTRGQKTLKRFSCHIPIQAHVSTSSYKPHDDFYKWVNSSWESKAVIPPYEPAIGVSDQLEECIAKKTLSLIESDTKSFMTETFKTLAASTLHSRSQQTSVDFLKRLLAHLDCVSTTDDIVRHLGGMARSHIQSMLSMTLAFNL